MASVPGTISFNQLIAYNLMRIRKAAGDSQEQAAARLEPFLGVRWSKAVYSAAERSWAGKRVRQFTAAELAAFAAAYGVSVLYFFLPPRPEDRRGEDGILIGDSLLAWRELFDVAIGGEDRGAINLRLSELPQDEVPVKDYLLVTRGYARQIRGEEADSQ
jgi:transcriptional regulator with XRE-family HTH domain